MVPGRHKLNHCDRQIAGDRRDDRRRDFETDSTLSIYFTPLLLMSKRRPGPI
jgi:hypothetical protein